MVDIAAIGGRLLRSPARGIRYGAVAGRGSRPGKGPATSRQRRAALVADETDSGPKGRPGPLPPRCFLRGYSPGKGLYRVKACTGRYAPSRPAAAGPGRRGTLL